MVSSILKWLNRYTGIYDLFGFVSIGSISYGAWLIYRPAGFIVGGVIVLILTLFAARGEEMHKGPNA